MTLLQLAALGALSGLCLLAATFPRRIAPPLRQPDPFKGLEDEWRSIMRD